MQLYLPIAEIPVNLILIIALGLVTGVLAGMFGIGGGFLSTPILIFNGVPPAVAVSTSANQIMASSVSGVLAHFRKRNVDIKMGLILLAGGFLGSTFGVVIFRILQKIGQLDIAVAMFYVIFLGSIGIMMFIDGGKIILERKYNFIWEEKKAKSRLERLIKKINELPYKVYFPTSDRHISIIFLTILSFSIGVLIAIMGIGGGFFMVPAMIYLLGMPSSIAVGTTLFQTIFIAGNTTLLQAATAHNVDIVLAFVMIVSSVIGAQIGTRISYKINVDNLRLFLAIIILVVCFKMFLSLFTHPASVFSIELLR